MAFTPSQWASEGMMVGSRRQEKHESELMTAELDRQTKTAELFGKIVDSEEKRYNFEEKQAGRGTRDDQDTAKKAQAKNLAYKLTSDTDDNMMTTAMNAARVAEESGDPAAWDAAYEAMSEVNPLYAKLIKESGPEARKGILESIGEGVAMNLETRRKGVELGMSGEQARKTLSQRQAGDKALAKAGWTATMEQVTEQARLQGIEAEKDRTLKGTEGKADRDAAMERTKQGHALVSMLDKWVSGGGDPEVAQGILKDAMSDMANKNASRAAGTQESPLKRYERMQKVEKAAFNNAVIAIASESSEVSGRDFDDPEEVLETPGAAKMMEYIHDIAGSATPEKAGQLARSRFMYLDKQRGFVGLPVDDNGIVIGDHDAPWIMNRARNTGQKPENVLRQYRWKLIKDKRIGKDDWNF